MILSPSAYEALLQSFESLVATETRSARVRDILAIVEKLSPELAGASTDEQAMVELGLSPRQRVIGHLVLRGLSNKEIAAELSIAEQTVKDHLRLVFQRADVHSRTQFAALIRKRGLGPGEGSSLVS